MQVAGLFAPRWRAPWQWKARWWCLPRKLLGLVQVHMRNCATHAWNLMLLTRSMFTRKRNSTIHTWNLMHGMKNQPNGPRHRWHGWPWRGWRRRKLWRASLRSCWASLVPLFHVSCPQMKNHACEISVNWYIMQISVHMSQDTVTGALLHLPSVLHKSQARHWGKCCNNVDSAL